VYRIQAEKVDSAGAQELFDRSPSIGFSSLKLISRNPGKSETSVRIRLRPGLERRAGAKQFHGGLIAACIDTADRFAIGMALGGGVRGKPVLRSRFRYPA
jgi:hypothetical protein